VTPSAGGDSPEVLQRLLQVVTKKTDIFYKLHILRFPATKSTASGCAFQIKPISNCRPINIAWPAKFKPYHSQVRMFRQNDLYQMRFRQFVNVWMAGLESLRWSVSE